MSQSRSRQAAPQTHFVQDRRLPTLTAHSVLMKNASLFRYSGKMFCAVRLRAGAGDASVKRKPRLKPWKATVGPGTVFEVSHGWRRVVLAAGPNERDSFEAIVLSEEKRSTEMSAKTEPGAAAGEPLADIDDKEQYVFDEDGVDKRADEINGNDEVPSREPVSEPFPLTPLSRPKTFVLPSQSLQHQQVGSLLFRASSSNYYTSIGIFAIALAAITCVFLRKKRSSVTSTPDTFERSPTPGFDDLNVASTGRAVPTGDNFFSAEMPMFAEPTNGFPALAKPRQISGEFKRVLRDMMGDLRRYSTVDLHGRNLGNEGAAYVSEALAFNDNATCVDFSANGIGDVGVVAICEALKSNHALEMLSLASNNLGDSATIQLAEYLKIDKTITTLNLNSSGIGDKGAAALADMLKVNTTLSALELNNNSIDYEGTCSLAEALVENSTLETLSLSGNYVGRMGASALANGLKMNSGIKGLFLNGNDIGNLGIQPLCRALSERDAKLTDLDVGNNGIGFEAGKFFADYIKQDSDLTHLNLYMNELCDLGATEIANALSDNCAIEVLDIGGNNILDAGAMALAEALKVNKTLRTLELGYNPIGARGAQAMAESVKFHSKVTTLRMGWCKITKDGAWYLADAIKYNEHICTLDLRGNELGDEGCTALAQSLQVVNENLISLDLGYNEIKDNGAFALAQAIKSNANGALQSISVNNNYITKFGEVALTEAVELVQEMNDSRELYIQF